MNAAVSQKSVKVNTRKFQFAHGRMPAGRGLWFFSLGEYVTYRFNGQYSVAVGLAVLEASRRGETEVTVMP